MLSVSNTKRLFEDYQILEVNFAPFEKVRLESGDGHRTPVIIFHTGTHLLRLRPTTGAHQQRLYLGGEFLSELNTNTSSCKNQ
jgi:hypothetical protein